MYGVGSGRGSVEAWYTHFLDIEEVLTGAEHGDDVLFVADVVKSLDTVDRGVVAGVLISLGLYSKYHAWVRLRCKLAAGLGAGWMHSSGCPLA